MEDVITHTRKLPILDADELQAIFDRAERTPQGCLLFRGTAPTDMRFVYLRGLPYKVTRIVWAETYGDADLYLHDVVHIAECPNTGGRINAAGHHVDPICIEPTHLSLALPGESRRLRTIRELIYRSQHA